MPRYIDADKLKETITDNFLNPYERSHIHALIDIQPTADVQEVRHGKDNNIEQEYQEAIEAAKSRNEEITDEVAFKNFIENEIEEAK